VFDASTENPTAIPPTDPGRLRPRDVFSRADGIRIAHNREDRRRYKMILRTLRTAKDRRQKINGNMEKLLRCITDLQSPSDDGDWPVDHCPPHSKLSGLTGISVTQTKELLLRAEELRLLDVGERRRQQIPGRRGSLNSTNRYVLLLPEPDEVGGWQTVAERKAATLPVDNQAKAVDADVKSSEPGHTAQPVSCGQQVAGFHLPSLPVTSPREPSAEIRTARMRRAGRVCTAEQEAFRAMQKDRLDKEMRTMRGERLIKAAKKDAQREGKGGQNDPGGG
jgi:hypothetical protein